MRFCVIDFTVSAQKGDRTKLQRLSSFSISTISFTVAVTMPIFMLLMPSRSASSCRCCVFLPADLFGKKELRLEKRRTEMLEFISAPEAAKKWGISERRVQKLCSGTCISLMDDRFSKKAWDARNPKGCGSHAFL